jgi:hypothetical protein
MCVGNCNDVVHFYYNDSQPLHHGRRDLFVLDPVALEFLHHKKQGRKPLRHLGMSRGDERGACKRTCLRLDSRFTEMKSQKEPKPI